MMRPHPQVNVSMTLPPRLSVQQALEVPMEDVVLICAGAAARRKSFTQDLMSMVGVSPSKEGGERRKSLSSQEGGGHAQAGTLYSFRGDPQGQLSKSLSITLSRKIVKLCWDESRRWVYLLQVCGCNPLDRVAANFEQ